MRASGRGVKATGRLAARQREGRPGERGGAAPGPHCLTAEGRGGEGSGLRGRGRGAGGELCAAAGRWGIGLGQRPGGARLWEAVTAGGGLVFKGGRWESSARGHCQTLRRLCGAVSLGSEETSFPCKSSACYSSLPGGFQVIWMFLGTAWVEEMVRRYLQCLVSFWACLLRSSLKSVSHGPSTILGICEIFVLEDT